MAYFKLPREWEMEFEPFSIPNNGRLFDTNARPSCRQTAKSPFIRVVKFQLTAAHVHNTVHVTIAGVRCCVVYYFLV